MQRLAVIVLVLATLAPVIQGHAEENRGSANYMLPLCKAWLDIAEKDAAAIKNIRRREPIRLTMAGMCAGFVIGVSETLRTFDLSCPPKEVTNQQLVHMVVGEVGKHPERLHEDFIVPASAAMMAAWPCPSR